MKKYFLGDTKSISGSTGETWKIRVSWSALNMQGNISDGNLVFSSQSFSLIEGHYDDSKTTTPNRFVFARFFICYPSHLDFDPEAQPEIKKSPDPSEISIRRNLGKPRISMRTKIAVFIEKTN